ncbi:MAG TPA: hypothetical protein VGJ15_10890 [Pirellulales bacterium]|jgi:hypothetical protein
MKIADLTSGSAKIATAYKTLRLRWDDTAEHWNDANRRRFEENYLNPLEPQIASALEAIARLAEILGRAEHECE